MVCDIVMSRASLSLYLALLLITFTDERENQKKEKTLILEKEECIPDNIRGNITKASFVFCL